MQENPETIEFNFTTYIIVLILLSPFVYLILIMLFREIEIIYLKIFKKPLLVFSNIFSKKLLETDKIYLNNFDFYKKLKPKYKTYFEHRVCNFLEQTKFSSRDILVTQEMRIAFAAVYIQLTFGLKTYINPLIKIILVYPEIYLSTITNQYHKGEFNPAMKTLVFSWTDFKKGFAIPNDNLNLGFHEFTHALHFSTLKSDKPQHLFFAATLNSLFALFSDKNARDKIIDSGFFREYAFENQYEFVAVLLEHFFESPQEFKTLFPEIFIKVKQLINYDEKVFG